MNLTPIESYDPMAGTLAALQTPDYRSLPSPTNVPTPCHCVGPQPGEKLCPCALRAASDSFARVQIADPWAQDGAQTAPDAAPRRANAGSTVAPSPGVNITILALDLGSKTGFAVRRSDGGVVHGTERFMQRNSWAAGQRWLNFRAWLSRQIVEHGATVIAYEDVKNHTAIYAAHVYGGFLAHLECVAAQHRVELRPVGVGTVKKAWTGSGSAKKDKMIAQAQARGFKVVDDNDADALAVLDWAVAQEKAA